MLWAFLVTGLIALTALIWTKALTASTIVLGGAWVLFACLSVADIAAARKRHRPVRWTAHLWFTFSPLFLMVFLLVMFRRYPSILWPALLLAILTLSLLIWSLIRMWLRRSSGPLSRKCRLGIIVGLLALDSILSLYCLLAASLGHSTREGRILPWMCLLLLIGIVLIPSAALILSERYRRADPPGKRSIRFQSALTFLFLSTLGLFALGRIGYWPPILYAARNGHVEMEKWLIEMEVDVNTRDRYDGHSALDFAAYRGDVERVKLLLKRGARDDNEDKNNPYPALIMASIYGRTEVVRMLLPLEDDRATAGTVALVLAARHGHPDLVEYLLDSGADPTVANRYSYKTAWESACEQGQIAVLRVLFRHPTTIPPMKSCALGLSNAALQQDLRLIDLLLEHGADINLPDDGKRTALMYAAMKGNTPTVQFLLDRNADPNLADAQSKTALDFAEEGHHTAICELLRGKSRPPRR